jgi:hypothetical protein
MYLTFLSFEHLFLQYLSGQVLFQQELCYSSHCLHISHHHNHILYSSPAIVATCPLSCTHIILYQSLLQSQKKKKYRSKDGQIVHWYRSKTKLESLCIVTISHYLMMIITRLSMMIDDRELLDELDCPVYTGDYDTTPLLRRSDLLHGQWSQHSQ